MFDKKKNKNKKYIAKVVYSVLVIKMKKHKEVCLSINGTPSVRLGNGTIEFKNYFKKILVPFKIYADFECNLKSIESYEGSYSKNIKIKFLVVLQTYLCWWWIY